MGLIGDCEDCGEPANLLHKPAVPMSKQDRPSVCPNCKYDREEMAAMHEPDPGYYEPIAPERY